LGILTSWLLEVGENPTLCRNGNSQEAISPIQQKVIKLPSRTNTQASQVSYP
jgi:hypothetical protein